MDEFQTAAAWVWQKIRDTYNIDSGQVTPQFWIEDMLRVASKGRPPLSAIPDHVLEDKSRREMPEPGFTEEEMSLFSSVLLARAIDDRIPPDCIGLVEDGVIVLIRMTDPPERLKYVLPLRRSPLTQKEPGDDR